MAAAGPYIGAAALPPVAAADRAIDPIDMDRGGGSALMPILGKANHMTDKADDATLLQLAFRAGIWEVTKDGNFYGHFDQRQQAFDAVEAAAHAIVASGGCADILLRGERSRPTPPTATATA